MKPSQIVENISNELGLTVQQRMQLMMYLLKNNIVIRTFEEDCDLIKNVVGEMTITKPKKSQIHKDINLN